MRVFYCGSCLQELLCVGCSSRDFKGCWVSPGVLPTELRQTARRYSSPQASSISLSGQHHCIANIIIERNDQAGQSSAANRLSVPAGFRQCITPKKADRTAKRMPTIMVALLSKKCVHLVVDGAELEGQKRGDAVQCLGYNKLKRASPGTNCRNLKCSTTLEYLNYAVRIVMASSLSSYHCYTTNAGTNSRMIFTKNPLSDSRSSTMYQISKPTIMAAQRMLRMRMPSSQDLSYIDQLIMRWILTVQMSQLKGNTYQFEDQAGWITHLHSHGSVVVKNVLQKEEVQRAKDYFWEWLEALGSGIKRDDPATWVDDNWPGSGSIGFFVSYGGCHTHASWYLRTRPKVKAVFGKIWNTNSLITSFDTFICWRPWWSKHSEKRWDPFVENLHIDQNPYHKKGFQCVQGMIPLVDVRADGAGGLQVVPNTNNDKTQSDLSERYKCSYNKSDWLQLFGNDPYIGKGELIECKAGDMILFDSRSIHGGKICEPSEQYKLENENKLARLAMTVTMVPRELQKPGIKQRRMDAFKSRIGLTHWPQEYNKSGFGTMARNIQRENIKYVWPELTPEIQDLI